MRVQSLHRFAFGTSRIYFLKRLQKITSMLCCLNVCLRGVLPSNKYKSKIINQHFIVSHQVTLKCQEKVHDNSQISVDGSSCHHVV